jgi:2-amino-4-hydroxy-6-hydroxymethyldihydropteridine diphosphokinase
MHTVYLALGSNLGDRAANLRTAIEAFEPEIQSINCSAVYETPPWGYHDQSKFLNQVVEAETDLSPTELLDHIKELEQQLGRRETFKYGPRMIDLDIIFFDDEVVDSPPLIIPHPRMAERGFVLMPLADIAPHFKHPILGDSVSDLLSKVDQEGIVQYSPAGCDEISE